MADDKKDIVQEVKERLERVLSWESVARDRFREDMKFANADSDNGYQWPEALRKSRDFEARPCLTINKTMQHNLLILNDARENKPAITVHPVSDDATYEAAQVYEGIIRHIEYVSDAQSAYDMASFCQVCGGYGYWRIVTDYVDDDTFDQDIYIRRIRNPETVALDPDIKMADGSDAEFGIIYTDMPKDEFERKYPAHKDISESSGMVPDGGRDDWLREDTVRVAEYYRKEYEPDTLLAVPDESGQPQMLHLSEIPKELRDEAKAKAVQTRKVQRCKIRWYLIAGSEVIDERDWAGRYIPIVRVVGQEVVIDGQLDRKGHTRALKDPQRMYNYWTSSAVEFVALQGKQPYIAPVQAIEGYENYWENANTQNLPYLPYNNMADDGSQIPAPQRQQPPTMAQGYIAGMQNAANEMALVSGQYQASFGAPSNEDSGVAINQRRRQGATATYHFVDELAKSVRYSGKILIDLIPHVYDTNRVVRIMGIDGSDDTVQIDPQQQQALQEVRQQNEQKIQRIFNPSVGRYDVVADSGPSYQTRREEAFQSITQVLSANPALTSVIGDLLFKAADFPMADEIAKRLSRMVPPQARDDSQDPQVAQLKQQLDQAHQVISLGQKALQEKASETELDRYKVETDRLKVMFAALDPREQRALIQQLVADMMQGVLPSPPVAPQQGAEAPQNGAAPTPGGSPVYPAMGQ